MTSQFHTAFHTYSDGRLLLNIGPVELEIKSADLHVFVDAISAIEKMRGQDDASRILWAPPSILTGTHWKKLGYVKDRDTYTMTYHRASWEADASVAVAAAGEVMASFENA